MADWFILLNGTRQLLTGGGYADGFYSPPYVALFLAPFAWLPDIVVIIAYYVLAFAAAAYVCYKLKLSPWQVAAVASSPPVIYVFGHGNLEPFVLLGAFLPAWAGLPLLAMKPQVGGGLIVYILYRRIVEKRGLADFVPLAILCAVSFAICPTWPMEALGATGTSWNLSFWPHSLIVGLPLLFYGIRKQDRLIALAASAFLTPYVGPQNLMAVLPLVAREAPVTLFVYLVAWIVYMTARGLIGM